MESVSLIEILVVFTLLGSSWWMVKIITAIPKVVWNCDHCRLVNSCNDLNAKLDSIITFTQIISKSRRQLQYLATAIHPSKCVQDFANVQEQIHEIFTKLTVQKKKKKIVDKFLFQYASIDIDRNMFGKDPVI